VAEKPTSLRRSPMARGVDEFIEKMRSVPGVDGLRSTFASAIGKLGFDTFVYGGMHIPQLGDDATPYILTTFPDSWQRRYFEREYHLSDPVITESLHRVTPMKWNHLRHRREFTHNEAIIMDEAREHGLVHGFTIPVHGHAAEFGLISLVSNETEREFDKLVTAYGHQVHLMAIYLHGAIQEALLSQRPPQLSSKLTNREVECLVWTAQGKTSWEISLILGISMSTVNFHLKNTMRKLGVYSKTHAVAKTLVLGLIHL